MMTLGIIFSNLNQSEVFEIGKKLSLFYNQEINKCLTIAKFIIQLIYITLVHFPLETIQPFYPYKNVKTTNALRQTMIVVS